MQRSCCKRTWCPAGKLGVVSATNSDGRHHVWVYVGSDATPTQVRAIRMGLANLPAVASVRRLR
jgi:hypothetical protein